ncbi:hypothetical protein [Cryptosporangium sp. NPDC051539]|uniref:hypothetical protein n=1 Tax=Cryptosporangium sp. NPDC051539 TaxID=3363962 RepID=UPI0037A19B70
MILRSEWTKFRSVRGWVIGTAVAALLILVFPVTGLGGAGSEKPRPIPLGPGGEPVVDAYYFVPRPLAGDGRITVEVTALESRAPWAKAGLLVRAGTRYAAILRTAGHGVRMQYDYTGDVAGPDPAARWLRLTRSGDTVIGEASADGTHWDRVGAVRLPGPLRAGLFVACPQHVHGVGTEPDAATATFAGAGSGPWTGGQHGAGTATFAGYPLGVSGGFSASAGRVTVTGAGDLAPATRTDVVPAASINDLLFGTLPALIVVVVIATLMATTEYRYGLIRSTLSATTRRGRVLLARAAVAGGVTFVAGLVGAALAVAIWPGLVRGLGVFLFPASSGAVVRVAAGTAAVLALAAVFALGVGTLLRRSAAAVTTVVTLTVLPYLLALVPFTPLPMAEWLTRVTPAAALAVQQTVVRSPQVDGLYNPANGYYPLSPWAGLAVLGGYAGLALALAAVAQRRRDV